MLERMVEMSRYCGSWKVTLGVGIVEEVYGSSNYMDFLVQSLLCEVVDIAINYCVLRVSLRDIIIFGLFGVRMEQASKMNDR